MADGCLVHALFTLSENEQAEFLANVNDRDRLLADGVAAKLVFAFAQEAMEPHGLGLVQIGSVWPGHGTIPLLAVKRQHSLTNIYSVPAFHQNFSTPPAKEHVLYLMQGNFHERLWLDQVLQRWRNWPGLLQPLQAWRDSYYHFHGSRIGTPRTQDLASVDRLDPTGGNLAAVLLYLHTDRPELFRRLQEIISQIVPNVGNLRVRTNWGQLQAVFENAHRDINLKDMGTGVDQLLMTLVVGLMQAPPFTLVIEEPELNLHPHAQRALLRLLQAWAADGLIMAATHSTVMLDWSSGGNQLWLVTKHNGASDVQPVDEDPLPLLRSLGVHLSDVLSADRLLVVEGPSDEDVLSTWFPELLRMPRVAILRGEGGENARHADRLAAWIEEADRVGLRRVLYLRDRDELSGSALSKLATSSNVYVLERRELENYLLNPNALAQVIRSIKPASASAPTSDEIAALIQRTAESLRTKIIVNRVCRRFTPPLRLIEHGLRKQLSNSASGHDEVVTAVLERLMTSEAVREQITRLWAEAEADVASATGAALLAIAPGEEILDAVFMHFAGRHYRKRGDGEAIAKATPPPEEIDRVIRKFLDD